MFRVLATFAVREIGELQSVVQRLGVQTSCTEFNAYFQSNHARLLGDNNTLIDSVWNDVHAGEDFFLGVKHPGLIDVQYLFLQKHDPFLL